MNAEKLIGMLYIEEPLPNNKNTFSQIFPVVFLHNILKVYSNYKPQKK